MRRPHGHPSVVGLARVTSGWQRALLGAVGVLAYVLLMSWLIDVVPCSQDVHRWGPALGASLALVFFMPESAFGRPSNLIVGHLSSAICAIVIVHLAPRASTTLLAAMAVPAATLAMLAADCVHPPGGATALLIAVGAPSAASPKLLLPLLLGVVAIVVLRFVLDVTIEATRKLLRSAGVQGDAADRPPTGPTRPGA